VQLTLSFRKRTKLPFTPFHMGAALIVKPGLNRNFSVITFGIAQVAMDIEPGIGMFTGAEVLHGPTHTILGALVIAYLVMLIAPSICSYLQMKCNKEVIHYNLLRLVQSEAVTKTAVIIGALFGTLSHVALDSLMHHDIQPLLPFSQGNPLMGLITHDEVYQFCGAAGVLGAIAWIVIKFIRRSPQDAGVSVAPKPMVVDTPKGAFVLWVKELRFTWFWMFVLTVIPSVLYGSSIISRLVLMAAVVIGIPSVAIARLIAKGTKNGLRRLAVMLLMPLMALTYVSQVDQKIPKNATPITIALESFRLETGNYPDTLETLIPKHLAKMPTLRFSIVQPHVTYRVTNGKPYLSLPSAMGDMFAIFEYNFETKVWIQYF
jgi:membrane-bound metal-dependent hydrolase YbcI (DUF457 family)